MAKNLNPKRWDSPVSRQEYNDLVEAIQELQKLRVGPGLEMRQSSAGTLLSVVAGAANGTITRVTPTNPKNIYAGVGYDWETSDISTYDGAGIVINQGVYYDTTSHSFGQYSCKAIFDNNGLLCKVVPLGDGTIVSLGTCP